MIPSNITKENIIHALEYIDRYGVPKNRESTKYKLKYKHRNYPPKYVISIANKYANKIELKPSEFSGGNETNNFLINLGFKISDKNQNIEYSDTSKKVETNNKNIIENVDRLIIATVLNSVDSNGVYYDDLHCEIIRALSKKSDIILFPAGYFSYNYPYNYSKEIEDYLVAEIANILKELKSKTVVVLGIDSDDKNNQIAIAIDKKGLVSKARKFHPTTGEKNKISSAKNYLSKEDGYSRIFKLEERKFYIAVCNDIYGISQKKLKNPGVDCVLNLIHGFHPRGEGHSGDVDFARKGLVGGSKQWDCPVFAAATYFGRNISRNWPSGVSWNQGNKSVRNWKYSDNPISSIKIKKFERELEKVEVRIFEL